MAMANASLLAEGPSPDPSWNLTESGKSAHPGLGRHSPHAWERTTGPRPGDAHPFRRSGQLAPVAGDARAPPRPRGGENRAGERVPPLFVLEPTGPAGQRTKRTFFVPAGAGPPWHT